ncbi:uncharacterized protein [Halyomorpha halys]|uniref:uncharacterized protein isoform X2 n=1 Tax=Halyomorpha halys TaxID=286706 RepID=UPI0006D4E18A|nr:protein FAM193A-like isoform X2 [Halyomorpha halys]
MAETSDIPSIRRESDKKDNDKALTALLHKLAFDDFALLDTAAFVDDDCSCESCNERRTLTTESIEEIKMIQSCWLELRQYIRIVYRLSMKGSLKSIDEDYQEYMKDIVAKLFDVCDPHQLYQRLEAQVKEFVIEVKVRLLQFLDKLSDNSQLPHIFISGLLDRYNKTISAANVIAPVLSQLEVEHLQQFNLSWKLLNQRLFHTIIYTDVFFQNSVPLFISQLGKANDTEENRELVKEFLAFDNEIGQIAGVWSDIETNIQNYLEHKATLNEKRKFLIHDWEEFKAAKRHENMGLFERPIGNHGRPGVQIEELQAINLEGLDPDILAESCECHVCLDASSHTPVELIEQVIPINSHRGGFHLYPHIHGTRGDFGQFVPECESEVCAQISDHQIWQGSFQKSKFNRLDHSISVAKKGTNKSLRNTKDSSTETNPHHVHCSKHSDIKRIQYADQEDEGQTNDDSHSDNSQSDPRHCDCCYCEVFGHGLPSAAPMSRNYQEMRERLRLLLNKKKSKCKSNIPTQPLPQRKQQPSGGNLDSNSERDTRALEDLLDFIEGTEVKCRNEKKAAKKARQKEKKRILMNRKKREEEEKARLLEEQKKREEALASKEAEEKEKLNSSKHKKRSKNGHTLVQNSKPSVSTNKPAPQMVTIKRVMEPHNSEPTVTITLRGATPNQDRVLYTLLNGQVCKVKDVPSDKKNIPRTVKNSNPLKTNNSTNSGLKFKDLPNDQIKSEKHKKDNAKSENVHSVPQNGKFVKDLSNPTSIQINNAINSMSKKVSPTFNIADIKLPPGITITKVDPASIHARNTKMQENNVKKSNPNQVRPPSEVIVVSTGKRKDSILKESVVDGQTGKRKKNKKKNISDLSTTNSVITTGKTPAYPGLEIQPIKIIDTDKDQELVNQMSVLTISPYNDNKPYDHKGESKRRKKKAKKTISNNPINPEEWKLLDSVFAPKDIDLDDGEIDETERELEAFKRFCLQSVPPERKEKVHLNIKDIVLKKKSASCNY